MRGVWLEGYDLGVFGVYALGGQSNMLWGFGGYAFTR